MHTAYANCNVFSNQKFSRRTTLNTAITVHLNSMNDVESCNVCELHSEVMLKNELYCRNHKRRKLAYSHGLMLADYERCGSCHGCSGVGLGVGWGSGRGVGASAGGQGVFWFVWHT